MVSDEGKVCLLKTGILVALIGGGWSLSVAASDNNMVLGYIGFLFVFIGIGFIEGLVNILSSKIKQGDE